MKKLFIVIVVLLVGCTGNPNDTSNRPVGRALNGWEEIPLHPKDGCERFIYRRKVEGGWMWTTTGWNGASSLAFQPDPPAEARK